MGQFEAFFPCRTVFRVWMTSKVCRCWVAGLGIDYALNSKTSIGLELSHYEFGSVVHDMLNNAGASNGYRIKQSNSHDTLTVNVTQHF